MSKFDVGYDGEHIGRYEADTPAEAIKACVDDMRDQNFKPDTPAKERLKGLIAVQVN